MLGRLEAMGDFFMAGRGVSGSFLVENRCLSGTRQRHLVHGRERTFAHDRVSV